MSDQKLHLPIGSVALKMHIFWHAEEELSDVLTPPWPRWMRRLYEMEARQSPRMKPAEGEVEISAAIDALKARLNHRLEILAWICGQLEDLGWDIDVRGSNLIASKVIVPEVARESLEAAGLAGSMAAVCEIDEHGWPRLYAPWELTG
jgi:hypothetical protein